MNNCRVEGFTLVELLVAMALSSIIILAVTATFASGVSVHKTQMTVTAKLENEMLFEQLLKRDLQNIDAWKCHSTSQDFPQVLGISAVFKQHKANAVWGEDNVVKGTNLIPGSDSIYLLGTEKIPLMKAVAGANTLEIAGANVNKKDILLVTDCSSVDVYSIKSIKASDKGSVLLSLDSPLSESFNGVKIQVYKVVFKHYSLRKGRNNTALYLSINNKTALELIPNIASFQIEYAVDDVSEQGEFLHRNFYSADEMDTLQLWQKLRQVSIQINSSDSNTDTFEFSLLLGGKG